MMQDLGADIRTLTAERDALAESHAELIGALDRLMVVGSAATGYLMSNPSDMHRYVEELMERPVMTHEMGSEEFADNLAALAKPAFVGAIGRARAVLDKAQKL